MVDLDDCKPVNDTYGHQAGDQVLSEAARGLQSRVRRYDSVGRYGGEEFLVVLPGCDGAAALAHAERLRESLFEAPFLCLRIFASPAALAFSWRRHPTPDDTDSLVREADEARYRAKHAGRNRVAGFSS